MTNQALHTTDSTVEGTGCPLFIRLLARFTCRCSMHGGRAPNPLAALPYLSAQGSTSTRELVCDGDVPIVSPFSCAPALPVAVGPTRHADGGVHETRARLVAAWKILSGSVSSTGWPRKDSHLLLYYSMFPKTWKRASIVVQGWTIPRLIKA